MGSVNSNVRIFSQERRVYVDGDASEIAFQPH
jgi:hypothetical protein